MGISFISEKTTKKSKKKRGFGTQLDNSLTTRANQGAPHATAGDLLR